VPLTFRSDKVKGEEGARYTIFVPASYDPLRATPLLVGLHGGGPGGKKGDKVVGSGPSAMNFYTGICEERGWICVCPTALTAGWPNEPNDQLLEAMLLEVQCLYNVDLNRVYLTGHSMGGFGTWYWGPKWAERWAAIAPMAGGGGPGLPRLKDTLTPVFVLHGTDDNVVGVDGDRAAAKSLLDSGHDFVYTELNGIGHGCPQEVLEEMAAWFEKKRLALGRGKAFRRSDDVRSSFLEKPGREEKHYLGNPEPPDPAAAAEKPEARRTRLLQDIDLGGGKAEAAAEAYADWKDADSVKSLAARLASAGKVADDVRAAAAKALGNIGSAEGLPTLERAVLDENDGVFHAALGAVLSIGDRKSGPALLRALDFQSKQFEGKLMGTAMDFSDFDPRSNALGAAAGAAAALADPKEAVARIRDRALRTFFEGTYRVQALARAGEFPEEIRNRTGRQLADALAKTASPAAKDVLQHLKGLCAKEASIADACDAALAALDGAAATAPPPPSGGG
jgi:acetyl esterase/lipase